MKYLIDDDHKDMDRHQCSHWTQVSCILEVPGDEA